MFNGDIETSDELTEEHMEAIRELSVLALENDIEKEKKWKWNPNDPIKISCPVVEAYGEFSIDDF
jgi:hypothetical protein